MYYTYKNIKQFASTNKIIFILFILCEFIAVVIMFFSYGTYQNFKILKNQEIHKYDINISFGNIIDKSIDEEYIIYECDGSIDNSAAKKFLSHISKDTFEEIEGIFYTAKSEPVSNLNNEPLEICFRLQYSPKEKKLVPFDTSFNNSTSMYGKTFSYEDYNNGVKKIILPSYYSPEYIGKNIIINGESYKVIGIDFIDECAVIPYINSPNSLNEISDISIMTNNIISQKAYDNIVNVAKNIFGDYAVIPQVDTINEKLPFYNSIMFIAIILVGLASIILALLFKYILLSRNKFISVLRICGCTNNKVRHIFISEILLSSTVSFILATVFYFNFIVKKLKKYFAYIGDVYSFNNCLLLGLIYFICIYIVLNIMIIINIKKSPISQLKQGGI